MDLEKKSLFRQQSCWNNIKWNKIYSKYNITKLGMINNIIKFDLGQETFYFDMWKGKIRKGKGTKWTSKIITFLKAEFKSNIPLRGQAHCLSPEEFEVKLENGWHSDEEGGKIEKGFKI